VQILNFSPFDGCSRCQATPAAPSTQTKSVSISGSVGLGGKNRPDDVRAIQQALNDFSVAEGGPSPQLAVDGLVGPKTLAAIRKFQSHHLGFSDGRVDPGGPTLSKLNRSLSSGSLVESNAPAPPPKDPLHNAKVATGLVLLAMADARQCINAARMVLDNAIRAVATSSPGLFGNAAIEKCQFHFRFQDTNHPLAELTRIREVFDLMSRQQLNSIDDFDGYFSGREGTFVADLSGKRAGSIVAHTSFGGARISPPTRYRNADIPDSPVYQTNHIYIMPQAGDELPDLWVRTVIHELAHFCGPDDKSKERIDDYGYGWPDGPNYYYRSVTPHQRCRNGDSFASFAFHCRYGRQWVSILRRRPS
jgi:hypothetical protein